MLIDNLPGGYRFLQGIEPYSCGVVALPGYEIVHVILREPIPWRAGFARIDAALQQATRDRIALCAIQLRSPAPWSMAGFIDFNRTYCAILEEWGLYVDGLNPIARTNVAPQFEAPAEPVLHAFSYTVPAVSTASPTFIVAGAGEVEGSILEEERILRSGETGADAMREKATHVMATMDQRLRGLGCRWQDVTAIDVYTIHPIDDYIRQTVLARIGPARRQGFNWLHSRPPVIDIECERDMRGIGGERRQ